jgi:hypothetical protein
MKPLVIDVAGTIKELVKWALTQALLLLGLLMFGLSAPLLFTVGAEWLAWRYPTYASTWAVIYMFAGPFACMIWMVFICHWHSIRQWRREGRDLGVMGGDWREAHGGIVCTVGKSLWFMVSGFLGSAIAEGVLIVTTFKIFPQGLNREGLMVFFAIAPLFVFAPVLLVLLSRWIRRDEYATA